MNTQEGGRILFIESDAFVDILAQQMNRVLATDRLIIYPMDSLVERDLVEAMDKLSAVAAVVHVFGGYWKDLIVEAHSLGRIVVATVSMGTEEGRGWFNNLNERGIPCVIKSRAILYDRAIITTLRDTLKKRA